MSFCLRFSSVFHHIAWMTASSPSRVDSFRSRSGVRRAQEACGGQGVIPKGRPCHGTSTSMSKIDGKRSSWRNPFGGCEFDGVLNRNDTTSTDASRSDRRSDALRDDYFRKVVRFSEAALLCLVEWLQVAQGMGILRSALLSGRLIAEYSHCVHHSGKRESGSMRGRVETLFSSRIIATGNLLFSGASPYSDTPSDVPRLMALALGVSLTSQKSTSSTGLQKHRSRKPRRGC